MPRHRLLLLGPRHPEKAGAREPRDPDLSRRRRLVAQLAPRPKPLFARQSITDSGASRFLAVCEYGTMTQPPSSFVPITTVEELLSHERGGGNNPFRDNNVFGCYEILKYCFMWPVALLRVLLSVIFLSVGAAVCWLVTCCSVEENEPYGPCLACFMRSMQWFMGRGLIFLWGFYWIEVSNQKNM